jgi:hypothetical protein
VETARVNVDGDTEADLKLRKLELALASVGRRIASPRINLEGAARAETQMIGVDLALDHLGDKSVRSGGLLSKLGGAFVAVDGAVGGLLGSLPYVGPLLAALGGSGIVSAAALTILAAAAAAVVLALGPLVFGLTLVTAGFAAFAAGAIPEITKVWDAVKKGGKAFNELSGPEKAVGEQIKGLKSQFGEFSKSLKPEVLRAFADALGIVRKVLPALEPVAKAAGKALDSLLKMMLNWINGPSGKKFLAWMQTEGPKAVATFGGFLQGLIRVVGEVLFWWDRLGNDLIKFVKDNGPAVEHALGNVVHAAENVIHAIGNVIHAVGNVVHAFGNILHAADNVGHAAGNIQHAMDNISHAIQNVINLVGSLISALGGVAGAVNSALGGIPGKILGVLSGNGPFGIAAGGIAGAAAGGIRSGLKLVGEHGPELVQMSAGSRVYNASQTAAMAAGGAPVTVVLSFSGRGGGTLDKALLNWIQHAVRVRGGGDVQVAFGTPP